MRCMSCGAEMPDGVAFCTSCGAKIVQPAQPQYNQNQGYSAPQPNPQYQAYPQPMPMAPAQDTTPISPWGYIGYNILFAIPIVGIIMLFVYAFGSNTNVNLKNYARSFLIMMLIIIAIYIVLFIILGAIGVSFMNELKNYSLIGMMF